MATLNITAPDGKKISINVPEGTPPEKYDALVEDVVNHYKQDTMDPRYLEGKMADGSREYPDTWQTAYQPAADLYMTADAAVNAPGMIRAVPKLAKAVPGVVKGLVEGAGDLASDMTGSLADAASSVGGAVKKGWNALTNNTPRGFGYAQKALATPETRKAAYEAVDFANASHPEVGDLVTRSAARPIQVPPEGVPALPTGEKGLATAEDVSKMPPGPGEAPTDLPKPNVDAFNSPIRNSVMSSPEEMLSAATSQRDTVGKAIENTLAKYDASGSFYNPETFNSQIKSMLERDANGNVMTAGVQGQINEAIKEAASSINQFAVNGPIKWSDAARIKTMLQGESKYGVQGLQKADEAFKQVASLLKEDIDNQAMVMLQKQGGNLADYQMLRDHYGRYSSLADSLNVAAKRTAANSPIPWWVKMGAGAALSAGGLNVVKGLLGH